MVAGPTVDRGFYETDRREHLQERPPPHRPGDSVRPFTQAGNLFGRHVVVEQDVGHLKATPRT